MNATHTTPAAHAQEYRHQLGESFDMADALDPDYLCDETEEDERWEREGRREMYEMLGEFYG